MNRFYTFLTFSLLCLMGNSQYLPRFQQQIILQLDSNGTFTNYKLRLLINTETPMAAGEMDSTGNDIRFGKSACDTSLQFKYLIHSGLNTDSTVIWVNIPTLSGYTPDTIYMYYGALNAPPASDFTGTFPSSFKSNGNFTLTGTQYYDWFEIKAGDTLNIGAEDSTLKIMAYSLINHGVIWGKGAGWASPNLSTVGVGQGGGGIASPMNSGSGGAGHGGSGGIGCSDAGDSPGAGGGVYGDVSDSTIHMGSSGGSSDNTRGGAGGGKVELMGLYVSNTGMINVDGNPGVLPGGARGGGGGAGGGVKINARVFQQNGGSIFANGGQGSDGTNTANDGGGGAGGGRIKLFAETVIRNADSISYSGGRAGTYGSVAGGNGNSGTFHQGFESYPETVSIGSAEKLFGDTQVVACLSFTFAPTGKVYSKSGSYYDTLSRSGNCDSLVRIDLSLNSAPTDSFGVDVCKGYLLPGGRWVTSSGLYIDTIPQSSGCDSIYKINVNVLPIQFDSVTALSCDAYSFRSGKVVTASGVYYDTIPQSVGCDSIIKYDITILLASRFAQSPTTCDLYTLPSGKVINRSGTYIDTLRNAAGCDSIITTQLTKIQLTDAVTQSGYTLTATQASGTWQWVDCKNNFSPVSGATAKMFTPAISGQYAVIVSDSGCSDTSTCYTVNLPNAAVTPVEMNQILVYPNPTGGIIWVSLLKPEIIRVYDALGKMVISTSIMQNLVTIDLSGFPPGLYYVNAGNQGRWVQVQ